MCNMILPFGPFSFHPTVEKLSWLKIGPRGEQQRPTDSGQQLTSSQLRRRHRMPVCGHERRCSRYRIQGQGAR